MYRRHGQQLGLVFLVCDLAVTAAVWLGAYFLRYAAIPSPKGIPDFDLVVAGLPTVLLLAGIAYRCCGLYEIHRLQQLPRELGVVCAASGLLFLLSITVAFYRRDLYESRLALAMFLVLNALALAAARRVLWRMLKLLRGRGLNYGRALIVGSGRMGRLVAHVIGNNRWTGLEAVGFVDGPGKLESPRLPRLGTIDELPQIIAQENIDHVFVALPLSRYGELPSVYAALAGLLVEVQLVPDVPQLAGMRLRTLEIDDVAFLSLRENPHHGWRRMAKRGMDLALGSAALVLLSPLMLLLAALVKLTSPGPVLYRQSRAGLAGRSFHMLKFRSMYVDAESRTGPVWAARGDDRCTPLGRFLRKWSLDELPQLFNVLAGDMSLVGPRPERGVFIDRFRQQLPNYTQRHQVKSGITGWAQVNGWRGNTSLRRRLEYDLYYICNWSLWLDLKILAMTLWSGFRHKNAY
jgi:Undecaprenyl-phosphate glucose phosphotransferase